jgi:hypothetical protein
MPRSAMYNALRANSKVRREIERIRTEALEDARAFCVKYATMTAALGGASPDDMSRGALACAKGIDDLIKAHEAKGVRGNGEETD